MDVFVANASNTGGDVQCTPPQWRALLDVLPLVAGGQHLIPIVRRHLEGDFWGKPVRVHLTLAQIEMVRRAAQHLAMR